MSHFRMGTSYVVAAHRNSAILEKNLELGLLDVSRWPCVEFVL